MTVIFFIIGFLIGMYLLFSYSNKAGYPRVECEKHTWKMNLAGGHYCEVCKLDTRKSLNNDDS